MDNSGNLIVEGNVGIGLSDPSGYKLEVAGDISFNGNLYQNGALFTGGSTIDQTTDVSLNNIIVHGDLSANDASFNVINTNSLRINGVDIIDGAPAALDTLSELAAALDNSANFATNVLTTLSNKQDTLTAGTNITITGNTISASGGGGLTDLSATSISDLSDVSFNAITTTQGNSLIWNNTDKVWESGTPTTSIVNTTTTVTNSGGWVDKNPTNEPAYYGFGDLVYNGNDAIYFVGGWENGSTRRNYVWKYTISTNTWGQVTTTGTFVSAISSHSTVFYNNALYVFGGNDGSNLNTLYKLDLSQSTPTWSLISTSGTISARREQSAGMYNSKLIIFGGYTNTGVNDVYEIDLASQTPTWVQLHSGSGTAPSGRYAHVFQIYQNKAIIFSGGGVVDCWEFNLLNNTWNQVTMSGTIPSVRSFVGDAMIDTDIYVYGGYSGKKSDFYKLDVTTYTWTQITNNTVPGMEKHGATFANGKFYVYGNNGSTTGYTYEYTIPTTITTYNPVEINKLSTYYALSIGPNYDTSNMDNSGNLIVEGNVGIGLSDPSGYKLEVAGDISFNGNLYQNGALFTGGSTIDETTDVSLNNIIIHGDLSANDASFNVIDVTSLRINGVDIIDGAPAALNTLSELATALDNSANFATNVLTTLSNKQDTLTAGTNITITGNTISASGGGGGLTDLSATSISDLSDVSLNGIQVNQTLKWDGEKLVPTTLATTDTKQGQVLETLTGVCDGRTVVVESGSYTLTNVPTYQDTTTSWADVAGSSISYKPPSGTKQVIFEFHLSISSRVSSTDTTSFLLFKLLIDGNYITSQNQEWHTRNSEGNLMFYRGQIDITGTDDISNGKLSSWSTNKTIKLQVAGAAGWNGRLFVNYLGNVPDNLNDTSTTALMKPRMNIIAIGESSGQAVTLTNNSVSDLSDISFNSTSTTDGQALVWNSTDGVWEAGAVASNGGGGSTIDETTDVSMNNTTIHGILDVSTNFTAGGRTSTTTTTSETIQWYTNQSNFTWSLTNDGTSTAPNARKNHSSIIDNSSNIVVFGGYDSTNSETNDVWKYNITNNTWSQLFTSTTPSDGAWDQITGSAASSGIDGSTSYNNELYVLSNSRANFQKYNPSTNTWTNLTTFSSTAQYGYSPLIAYKGHIYCVDNENGYRSVWDYNINTDSWTQISNVSDSSHDRYSFALTVYNNNIYVYGGRHIPYTGGYFNDIWKFDLTNNTWSEVTGTTVTLDGNSSSMPSIAYIYFTSNNDNLYMFGGTNGSRSNKLYIYNVTNNTLTGYTTSISARDAGMMSYYENNLYIFGGYNGSNLNELIKYDLITHTHTTISQSGTWPSVRRDLYQTGTSIGNTFYSVGGYTNGAAVDIWRYTISNTPNKLKHTSSILNGDETVTIFGGSNGNYYYNSIYNFNLVSNSWSYSTVLKDNNASDTEHGNNNGIPSPRHGHSSVKYNNKMYMFGGKGGSTTYYDTWEYDLTTTTWTKKALAQSSYARYEHTSIIYNGDMYVFGGYDGTNYFNNILKYDITNDTWSEYNDGTASGTPTARYGHISVIMQNEMIIFGGTTQSGHVEDSYMFNFVDNSWNLLDNDDSNRPTDSYSTTAEIQYYNPSDNHYKLFVFGGETPLTNKLYVADISRNNVTNTTSTTTPHILTFNSTNGRVGIGTNTPSKSLDVGGDINFTGSLYQNGSVVNIGSSTFNQNTNLSINSLTTVNDINFGGNLYQNGALFTGGSTIDETTDVSLNNLIIHGDLSGSNDILLNGRITIAKEERDQTPVYDTEYQITFNGGNTYNNWILYNTSNSNGGNIPVNTDWTIEYSHKITIGNGENHGHFAIVLKEDGISSTDFGNNTYFMYYATFPNALVFRYHPADSTNQTDSIPSFTWSSFSEFVEVKWEYTTSNNTMTLYFNGITVASISNLTNSSKIYGTWGFGEWNDNTHHLINPRITHGGTTYTITTVNSTSSSAPTVSTNTTNTTILYAMDVSGKAIFSDSVTANGSVLSSDDRIKHNEQPITNALSTISKITPKHYFKTGSTLYDATHNFPLNSQNQPLSASGTPLLLNKDYTLETGIIAQELRTIPELSFAVQNTTPLGVDYNSIHCTHIAATKELHQLVQSQQTQIEEQQNEIEHLKMVNMDMNNQLSTALEQLEHIKRYLAI
jgi:hypothetical protein